MRLLMLKDLPRYECLLEAAGEFPDLDPSATEAFLHLLRTGDEAFRVVESHLAGHNVSQGRFSVLMSLWRGCRQRQNCEPALRSHWGHPGHGHRFGRHAGTGRSRHAHAGPS